MASRDCAEKTTWTDLSPFGPWNGAACGSDCVTYRKLVENNLHKRDDDDDVDEVDVVGNEEDETLGPVL